MGNYFKQKHRTQKKNLFFIKSLNFLVQNLFNFLLFNRVCWTILVNVLISRFSNKKPHEEDIEEFSRNRFWNFMESLKKVKTKIRSFMIDLAFDTPSSSGSSSQMQFSFFSVGAQNELWIILRTPYYGLHTTFYKICQNFFQDFSHGLCTEAHITSIVNLIQ